MSKSNIFCEFINFIKKYWKFYLLSCFLVVASSFAGALFQPVMRGINKAVGIVLLILFVGLAVFSVFYIWKKCRQITKESPELHFSFLFYFSLVIISGIFITVFAIVVRAVNSDSKLIIEGFASMMALVSYYLVLGLLLCCKHLLDED